MASPQTAPSNHNNQAGQAGGGGFAGPTRSQEPGLQPAQTAQSAQQGQASGSGQPMNATKRKRRAIDLTYCEFNLATMTDTRGGFLAEEPAAATGAGDNGSANAPAPPAKTVSSIYDRPIHPDPRQNPRCVKCKSIDIDVNYEKHFNELVCRKCTRQYAEEYSLLTKTECREDYLLTESELRDTSKLPHWIKANPHKSTYSNMLLYLRKQVEAFAWNKWGSPEALDAEFERREDEKQERKAKKFKKKLAELRKKTRTSTWQLQREQDHEHEFGDDQFDEANDRHYQKCQSCGLEVEFETL